MKDRMLKYGKGLTINYRKGDKIQNTKENYLHDDRPETESKMQEENSQSIKQ